jgi:hypothetical protein
VSYDDIRPRLWAALAPPDLLDALASPPSRYGPVPWLAVTGQMDRPRMEAALVEMLGKGITEFFLFPIYGLETPYMSEAWWELVAGTLEWCAAHGMKCWIYDEYNWPSGTCAGTVIRDHPEARQQMLWIGTASPTEGAPLPPEVGEVRQSGGVSWAVGPMPQILISVRGCDWLNEVPGAVDVLSAEAMGRFVESTHDKYYARHAAAFPAIIPGFFTDEPGCYGFFFSDRIGVPFTADLPADFRARFGYDLMERLGDLLGPSPTAAQTRCHYWRWIGERFGQAFAGTLRAWCDAHGVALTGHLLGEEALGYQVVTSGDVWEALRNFTIPGIDMLGNADGFTYPDRVAFYGAFDRRAFHLTCKLAHAVVRHSGGREMMSEAYGVCDWGQTLKRQRRGFHYQVALGVTLFNDNSLVTSVADFRKYAIAGKHFTQPWWRHYGCYSGYNARLAALHAEGEPVADVAVLYPRSTIWALTDAAVLRSPYIRAESDPLGDLQLLLYDLSDVLIRRQWHFDFLFEPVLAEATVEGEELVTAHARYRALVVPGAEYLPEACARVVAAFAAAGGVVVFAGAMPKADAETGAAVAAAAESALAGAGACRVGPSGAGVAAALRERLTPVLELTGEGALDFVSSRRRLAGSEVLMVANMADAARQVRMTTTLPEPLAICDPETLALFTPTPDPAGGLPWHFEPEQAFLVISGEGAARARERAVGAGPEWLSPREVLVLGGEWEFSVRPANLMRLSCQVRPDLDNRGAALGWHRDVGAEGWITPEDGRRLPQPISPRDTAFYWLRATVTVAPGAAPRLLVADNPDFLEVFVNGAPAEGAAGEPLWTEENVLFDVGGLLKPGSNVIHIRARTSKYQDPRFAPLPNAPRLIQPVVILGEFAVGEADSLVPWTGRITADAPWEQQGLPHFAGVGTYRRRLEGVTSGRALLHLPGCSDAVEVFVDGKSCGVRPWPPYVFDLTSWLGPGGPLEIAVANTLGNVILETYDGLVPSERPRSGLTVPPRLLFL